MPIDADALTYLIYFIIKNDLVSLIKLYRLRSLCKKWKQVIESENMYIDKLVKYQIEIKNKLKYDKDIYDQHSYKRIIIKNALILIYDSYKKLKIPYINLCVSDDARMYFIDEHKMPYESRC